MRAAASRSSRFVKDSSLPLQNRRGAETSRRIERVPGGRLMWVLAVAQIANLVPGHGELFGQQRLGRALSREHVVFDPHAFERGGNRRIVGTGMRKGAPRELETERCRRPALAIERLEHTRVVRRRHDHEYVAKIFRRRAHQARTTDINLLDEVVETHVGPGSGRDERIQIYANEIDERDAVRRGGVQIRGVRAPRQNAAVDIRMQRFDTTVHHLGKARHV